MTPFIVLVGSVLLFRALGALAIPSFRSWVTSLRWALAVMFLLTASAHFGDRRPDLVRMVPPSFPRPELLVTLTGVAEILGAAGLLLRRLSPWAASGLALLLVAMFPANVHAARAGLSIGDVPVTSLVPRAVLQVIFLGAALVAGFGASREKEPRVRATATPGDRVSRRLPWAGWIISAVLALLLLLDGVAKVMKPAPVVAAFARLGYPEGVALAIGLVELACTVVYLVPRASVLGAILLTGFLGGATATHVRMGEPFVFPIAVGVLVWGGLYLRDGRLRVLLRSRSTEV